MPRATWEPIQIPADIAWQIIAQSGSSDDRNHNVTLKVPKKTSGGADGQVVLKGGKITGYTDPT